MAKTSNNTLENGVSPVVLKFISRHLEDMIPTIDTPPDRVELLKKVVLAEVLDVVSYYKKEKGNKISARNLANLLKKRINYFNTFDKDIAREVQGLYFGLQAIAYAEKIVY